MADGELDMADFTIAEFLAWVRTKPAGERYNYYNSTVCPLAQFGLATDRPHLVGPSGTILLDTKPVLNDALARGGQTFGALVERLEAVADQTA